MKLRPLFAALAIGATGLTTGTAHAQGADPCSVYTCMAGLSGSGAPGGAACTAPIATFHAIQVWSPHFNSSATAAARRRFLMKCPGAQEPTNLVILNAIIAEWGYSP
ncbi:TrbM/KikA/MpfK family conjugal transfer protein [Rhodanobacter sp. DHB23]|uniref:TrbM/KikA/MpfK family conjugal transfer protein n=1 Tax=Rhodanobacter sp. DHB23 TaxID=2775923 RepID=UPI00177A7A84|nr:TrbM/KikA/MpfK family conjugal transfer protein [Rhodanobacter sp. DHB23]MBD8873466.1 hypothetical protein [Rhodanobacter sp. DHB23]